MCATAYHRIAAHRRCLTRYYAMCAVAALVGGLLTLNPKAVPSKQICTLSWALISVASVMAVCGVFLVLDVAFRVRIPPLLALGQNPFLLYIMNYLVRHG